MAVLVPMQYLAFGQTATLGGLILGTVSLDSTGKRIPAATVTLDQLAASTGKPIASKTTYTGKDGAFAFSGLPPGRYRVCAQLSQSLLLNPCDWDPKLNILAVSENQILPSVRISLKEGVLAPVRIDDPSDFIAANEGKKPGASILIGAVLPNGTFLPISPVDDKKTMGGREHQILIPVDTDVKMVAASRVYQLSDSSGKKMRDGEATAGQSLTAASSNILNRGTFNLRVNKNQAAAAKVTVRVTGVEAQ